MKNFIKTPVKKLFNTLKRNSILSVLIVIGGLIVFLSVQYYIAKTPTKGMDFTIEKIIHDNAIDLPVMDEKSKVEIFDNWVIIHYEDGTHIAIDRGKIWLMSLTDS